MDLVITATAEKDFVELTSVERQTVTRTLLQGTPLNMKKIAGLDDLYRIRIAALRLPAKRIGSQLAIMRIMQKPNVDRFFSTYRSCKASREVGNCVPVADSAIGAYARGQTPAGMLELLEERIDAQLSELRDQANTVRQDIIGVREVFEFLVLSQAECGRNTAQLCNELSDEFILTLESVEERVAELESPRPAGFVSWFRPILAAFISNWPTTYFCRSSTQRVQAVGRSRRLAPESRGAP